ncbi:hypothetical protein AgCh_021644 [Apium graveolens]
MAGISSCFLTAPRLSFLSLKKLHGPRCCSHTPKHNKKDMPTPSFLKIAVSGFTEILRLFSSTPTSVDVVSDVEIEKVSISCIDDILDVLKSDYEKEYFVTGSFTPEVYVDDCIFEDPTIRFRGKALYSRNLNLLVPFFDHPSIILQQIKTENDCDKDFVVASWKLRTYLKLPWKPLICIDGSTVYDLNNDYQIIRHAESWNVSVVEAIGQIFTPSFGSTN